MCLLVRLQEHCRGWAGTGQCDSNPDFMLAYCPQSCQACHVLRVSQVPRYRVLNNGYLLPSVGFGTAALGQRTADAVTEALLAGYRMFDTAEVSATSEGDPLPHVRHALMFTKQPVLMKPRCINSRFMHILAQES